MKRQYLDYSLYLVTEENMQIDKLLQMIRQAVSGGVTLVQLREKEAEGKLFYEKAVQVKACLDELGVPLIINDRVDIALAVQAAGVHVGQTDLPLSAVKQIIPPSMTAGISARSVAQAVKAEAEGADYIGVGSVFPTRTKGDAKNLPEGELQKISDAVNIPVVAIGGITIDNIDEIGQGSLSGYAVVSAITQAKEPKLAAETFKRKIKNFK